MMELNLLQLVIIVGVSVVSGFLYGFPVGVFYNARKRVARKPRVAGTTTLTVSPIADVREGDFLRVERVER